MAELWEGGLIPGGILLFMEIGSKIRDLRILKGLTQEELADRSELSKSFISQVERDITSPSIATLCDILQCLGSNPADFFKETRKDPIVFTDKDYFEKEHQDENRIVEWIIPTAQKHQMEPIRVTLGPDGTSFVDDPHEGEEFGYILSGSIVLHIGSNSYKVKKGESFYFVPNEQHYITSKSGAKLIWVCTPPYF